MPPTHGHPERSDCFAKRSSRAVEGHLAAVGHQRPRKVIPLLPCGSYWRLLVPNILKTGNWRLGTGN